MAHYDIDGRLDNHVLYLLNALRNQAQTCILVSTSGVDIDGQNALLESNIKLIQRKNIGYDFYSYKTAILDLDLTYYDELILCNDSIYGPFYDLDLLFDRPPKNCDFWGITENYEFAHHLQSYFLVFNKAVLHSSAFREFWQRVESLDDKNQIIRQYEIGLTQHLLSKGFRCKALVASTNINKWKRVRLSWRQYIETIKRRWQEKQFWRDVFAVVFLNRQIGVNPTHSEWEALIQYHRIPFIKVELLRDNPKKIKNLDKVLTTIKSIGSYPTQLISDHLNRVKRIN